MNITEIAYNLLLRSLRPMARLRMGTLWTRLWDCGIQHFEGPVYTKIHGRRVLVNYGFTYPVTSRRFETFNAPLVELAWQTWKTAGRRIRFVDVGAAIGDTVLLLYGNLPDAFSGFDCVDGDPEFLGYLRQNLGHLSGMNLVACTLSANEEEISSLVRIHAGTASAQGNERVMARTLSSVLPLAVDLIKIDVDGFDGRVLLGAEAVLKRDRPTVIFEWHPILCQQVGNSWRDHFDALAAAGYSRCIWFTKYGTFSHFTTTSDHEGVAALAEYCCADVPSDWHYDVVALHDESAVSPLAMAQLTFARRRPSPY